MSSYSGPALDRGLGDLYTQWGQPTRSRGVTHGCDPLNLPPPDPQSHNLQFNKILLELEKPHRPSVLWRDPDPTRGAHILALPAEKITSD